VTVTSIFHHTKNSVKTKNPMNIRNQVVPELTYFCIC